MGMITIMYWFIKEYDKLIGSQTNEHKAKLHHCVHCRHGFQSQELNHNSIILIKKKKNIMKQPPAQKQTENPSHLNNYPPHSNQTMRVKVRGKIVPNKTHRNIKGLKMKHWTTT